MSIDDKPKSLFEKMFTMTDADAKLSKLPLLEKKIKRQLDSAFDDAEGKIIEAQERKETCMKNFEQFDINSILEANQRIEACKSVQDDIRSLYKEYFSEELEGWQNTRKKQQND